MMKKIIPYLLAIFLVIPLMAQTYEVKLELLEDKVPGTYNVDLSLLGFTDTDRPVGAVTLYIEYDDNLLTYKDYELYFPGTFVYNPNFESNSVLKLEWSDYSNESVIDDVFITLVFDYTGGFDAALSFLPLDDDSIADKKGNPFETEDITLTNGGITKNDDNIDGTLMLESQISAVNQTVIVPVKVLETTDFDGDAYAMDLQIAYDTDRLVYKDYQSNTIGFDFIDESNGIITLQISGTDPLDFSASTLLVELEFDYVLAGPATVEFQPGSQVNGEQGDILSTRFIPVVVDIGTDAGKLSISKEIAQCTEEIPGEPPFDPEPLPERVFVEITAEDLDGYDLGMITLKMQYDYEKLDYISYTANQFAGKWLSGHNSAIGELIFIISDAENNINIADGTLLTLEFDYLCNVPEGEDGQADISFVTGTLLQEQAPDLGLILPELVDGWVSDILPGDANCDGEVTVDDITVMVQYILDQNPQPFCFQNADIAGGPGGTPDGLITVDDITAVVQIILSQP